MLLCFLCLRLRFNILVAHDYGKTLFGVKIIMNAVNMDKEVIFFKRGLAVIVTLNYVTFKYTLIGN